MMPVCVCVVCMHVHVSMYHGGREATLLKPQSSLGNPSHGEEEGSGYVLCTYTTVLAEGNCAWVLAINCKGVTLPLTT